MKYVPFICLTSCLAMVSLLGCGKTSVESTETVSPNHEEETPLEIPEPQVTVVDSIKDLSVPSTLSDRFSYTYGYMLFLALKQQGFDSLDASYFAKGAWDAEQGNTFFSHDEMSDILHEVQTLMLKQAQNELEALAEKNLTEANDFLTSNKQAEGVFTTESGLQYAILREGEGASPADTDFVEVDYRIHLLDGTVIDSSYDRGTSSTFQLKAIGVPGFIEGVKLMKPGAEFRFWVPPDLGYGQTGSQSIGPNVLLVIEVELKSIRPTTMAPAQ